MKKLMLGISIIIIIAFSLTKKVNANTELRLDFSLGQDDDMYIIKNSYDISLCDEIPIEKQQYLSWGFDCTFRGKIPENVLISYIKWLPYKEDELNYFGRKSFDTEGTGSFDYYDTNDRKVSEEVWWNEGIKKRVDDLNNLKEDSWNEYNINIQKLLEKYEGKRPKGKPIGIAIPIGSSAIIYPSIYPYNKDKVLTIEITLDKNDKLKVNEIFKWKDEYSKNMHVN